MNSSSRPTEPAKSIDRLLALSVAGTALTTAVLLVKSKVTAQLLGPAGVGVAAEIQQAIALATVPLAFVTGPALIKGISSPSGSRALASARTLVLTTGLVGVALAVAGASVAADPGTMTWVALAGLTGVLSALVAIDSQVLVARARLKDNGVLTVAQALAAAIFGVVGTVYWGLDGQFAAGAMAAALAIPLANKLVRAGAPDLHSGSTSFDWSFAKTALTLGASGLLSAALTQAMWSAFRVVIHSTGGAEANGQLQAARMLTVTYFGVALQSMGNVVFPSYAQTHDTTELKTRITEALDMVLRFVPPLLFVGIALRTPIIHILFSSKFDEAAQAAGLQMASDMAKAAAWATGGALLFKGRLRSFMMAEVTATAFLAASGLILGTKFGIQGIAAAHLIGYTASTFTNAWFLKEELGIRLSLRHQTMPVVWTIVLASAAAALQLNDWLTPAAVAVGVGWVSLIAKQLLLSLGPKRLRNLLTSTSSTTKPDPR